MRPLISALAAAGIIGFSFATYAADEPYTAQPKIQKPGRAADEGGSVTSGKKLNKPGREIDDGTVKPGGVKKHGREIEGDAGDAVKAPNKPKHGRALDNSADNTVKSPSKPKEHGRALNDEKK